MILQMELWHGIYHQWWSTINMNTLRTVHSHIKYLTESYIKYLIHNLIY